MNTTTTQLTNATPRSATAPPVGPGRPASTSSEHPSWVRVVLETAPIVDSALYGYGPPIIFVLGPWLLLVLLFIGPFALIVTLLLALAVAAGLLAACVAVIASPYLLVRHLRAHGRFHAKPRAPLRVFTKHRVSAGRLGSPQPKGVS